MRHQREPKEVHQYQYRAGWSDHHHLKPRSKGGQSIDSNLLRVDVYRHDAWHLLFKNNSLDDVILILQRLQRIKRAKRIHKRIH